MKYVISADIKIIGMWRGRTDMIMVILPEGIYTDDAKVFLEEKYPFLKFDKGGMKKDAIPYQKGIFGGSIWEFSIAYSEDYLSQIVFPYSIKELAKKLAECESDHK